MVEKPFEIGIDDLVRKHAAGGAGLPPPLRRGLGDGGALDRLPAEGAASTLAKPLLGAKYVRFETFLNPRDGARPARSAGIPGPIRKG